jgi:hypothetical protein
LFLNSSLISLLKSEREKIALLEKIADEKIKQVSVPPVILISLINMMALIRMVGKGKTPTTVWFFQ